MDDVIDAARAALAEYDAPRCAVPLPPAGDRIHLRTCGLAEGHAGEHRESGRVLPLPSHLRNVLSALDAAVRERDLALDECDHGRCVLAAALTRHVGGEAPDGGTWEGESLRGLAECAEAVMTGACGAREGLSDMAAGLLASRDAALAHVAELEAERAEVVLALDGKGTPTTSLARAVYEHRHALAAYEADAVKVRKGASPTTLRSHGPYAVGGRIDGVVLGEALKRAAELEATTPCLDCGGECVHRGDRWACLECGRHGGLASGARAGERSR